MFVVMTSSAHMPQSCKGRYRRVAVVEVLYYDWNRDIKPAMISRRARGVSRLIDLGHHSVGITERCAYMQAIKRAEALAQQLNNERDMATVDNIIGAGGSA